MNGDSALTETSTGDQGDSIENNITASDVLEPANDKEANGLESVDSENSSNEKLSNEKLSDNNLTDKEQSDEKLSDKELSDKTLSNKELSDEKLSNKELSDEKLSNQKLSDEKLSNEKITNKPTDEKLSDEEPNDEKLSDEEPTDEKLSDKEPSDKKQCDDKISKEKPSCEKPSDEELSDEKLSDVEPTDEELSGEKPSTIKHSGKTPSDEKLSSKEATINPNEVPKTHNEINPVDGADISTKNACDNVAPDEIKDVSCNLNCDEKVAESDTDPLAPQSSDSERAVKPPINKEKTGIPRNNDDAVSVNSESDEDELLCLGEATPNSDIILIGGEQNGDSEIHEILSDDDNDDCVVTSEKAEETSLASRRTRRIPKRNSYYSSEDEIESDVEVISFNDPLNDEVKLRNKQKRIIAASVRAKQKKAKKARGIVVVDPMDIVKKKIKHSIPIRKAVDSKKLHENIAACGTTITPVTAKDSSTAVPIVQRPVPEPEPILPSLTDDMFVVEAPSFIVPYVYEKPAEVHFRNFVNKLGTELEEQKAKEEELRIQKEKEEKEKRDKEIELRKEQGQDYSDLLDDNKKDKDAKEEEKQKKKQLKQERRRKRRAGEEDDPAWEADNAETSSSEDLSDDDMKARRDDLIGVVPTAAPKVDSYFATTLGKFFMDIGMSLVQQNVQCDLLKQENRKLNREKRGGYNTKATQSSIAALTNNIEKSKEKNASYTFTFEKCKLCSFKTESSIVMANHMEVPHMKNNMFVCNYCLREIKGCHDILVHMLLEHQVKGRLERSQVSQQCATCPYEDNNKTRMGRHIINCMKKFKPDTNLAVAEWEPPAKIPKLVKPPTAPANAFHNSRGMYAGVNVTRPAQASGTNSFQTKPVPLRPHPRPNILTKANDTFSKQIIPPPKALVPPNTIQRNRPGMDGNRGQATLAISPLPGGRGLNTPDSSFVMCEICDGYIKDLDQLRNHMLWIHKIKIHPKMIHNRPPLNCQKCQFRFFTDQGLERHLLGAHGLVTSSMQEAANSRKDCGRCPICGRVYQYKLLGHVARDHNMTLKPAHLSYKCTVCTATFDTYKEFESHVYSAHRVVTKRLTEKAKATEESK